MSMRSALLSAILLSTVSPPAGAAMPPATYFAKAEGNKVTICPQLLNKRACPQPEGMLRQDASTGKVVRLPQHCTEREVLPPGTRGGVTGDCYVDECVPPGTYRYGYAKPLECMGAGSKYYFEVKVTRPLPPDCARTSKPPTPHPRAPWSKSPWVCVRSGCGCDQAGGSAAGGLILALLAAAALLRRRQRRSAS